MQGFWSAPSPAALPAGLLTVVNMDSIPSGAADPFATAKVGFAQSKGQTAQAAMAAGATDSGASAVVQNCHGGLVPPFCNTAVRGFFRPALTPRPKQQAIDGVVLNVDVRAKRRLT